MSVSFKSSRETILSTPFGHCCAQLALLCIGALIYSCGESPGPKTTEDVPSEELTTDLQDVIWVDTNCPALNPTYDDDSDGLSNAQEDRNRNCQRDEGETDPQRADTDGDGIIDGDEDINRNGRVDEGESDPRLFDTDGDGTPDGAEAVALICTPSLLAPTKSLKAGGLSLLLPDGFKATTQVEDGALFESETLGVYALLYTKAGSDSSPQVLLQRFLQQLREDHKLDVEQLSLQSFESWLDRSLLQSTPRLHLQAQLQLRFGDASPNPQSPDYSARRFRDLLFESVSGQSVESEAEDERCARLSVFAGVSIRNANAQQFVFAVTCDERQATRFAMEDLTNGSTWMDEQELQLSFWCGESPPQAAPNALDVLWIVDNSPSMASKLEGVAASARRSVDILEATGANWRIGVSTTESYLLDAAPTLLEHDPWLDSCSGLRGEGFLDVNSENPRQRLETLIAVDPHCSSGVNACGHKRESALRSSQTVLQRAAQVSCSETHRWRNEARRVLFWASDEEDQIFKFDDDFFPASANDPRRAPQLSRFVELLLQQRVVACAIVGDEGLASGGYCGALSNEFATQGAQHGLGYIEAARATGGSYASICAPNFDAAIDDCILGAFSPIPRFVLPSVPISNTLRVVLDGEALERSSSRGWYYDASNNAILFAGLELAANARIAVAYQRWIAP